MTLHPSSTNTNDRHACAVWSLPMPRLIPQSNATRPESDRAG